MTMATLYVVKQAHPRHRADVHPSGGSGPQRLLASMSATTCSFWLAGGCTWAPAPLGGRRFALGEDRHRGLCPTAAARHKKDAGWLVPSHRSPMGTSCRCGACGRQLRSQGRGLMPRGILLLFCLTEVRSRPNGQLGPQPRAAAKHWRIYAPRRFLIEFIAGTRLFREAAFSTGLPIVWETDRREPLLLFLGRRKSWLPTDQVVESDDESRRLIISFGGMAFMEPAGAASPASYFTASR